MAAREHRYSVRVVWTGNTGDGTRGHGGYERAHDIAAVGKPTIPGSSDPAFRGDGSRWNPEDLLVASLSACHELWYLSLCSQAGIVVVAYEDTAEGCMVEEPNGAGRFTSVVLRPVVTIAEGSDQSEASRLHREAHGMCFVARSVNFPVSVTPTIEVGHAP